MKKLISLLFIIAIMFCGQAAKASVEEEGLPNYNFGMSTYVQNSPITLCEKHPKICHKVKAAWRATKKFCGETLVVVQWTASAITVIILLPAVILI